MEIPIIIKINHIIFIMQIPIPGKMVFILKQASGLCCFTIGEMVFADTIKSHHNMLLDNIIKTLYRYSTEIELKKVTPYLSFSDKSQFTLNISWYLFTTWLKKDTPYLSRLSRVHNLISSSFHIVFNVVIYYSRDYFVNAPSQWEMTLQCNIISHWLGAYTKWSLLFSCNILGVLSYRVFCLSISKIRELYECKCSMIWCTIKHSSTQRHIYSEMLLYCSQFSHKSSQKTPNSLLVKARHWCLLGIRSLI